MLAHDAKRERRDVLEVIHLSLAHNGTAAYAEAEPAPQRQKSLPQRFNAGITRVFRHRAEHLFQVLRLYERGDPVGRRVQLALTRQHSQWVHHAQAQLLHTLFLLVRQRERKALQPVRQKFTCLLIAIDPIKPFHRSTLPFSGVSPLYVRADGLMPPCPVSGKRKNGEFPRFFAFA